MTVERFGVNVLKMRRQDGLATFLGGNAELANIMGADEDIAEPVFEKPTVLTVCDKCAFKEVSLAELVERQQ